MASCLTVQSQLGREGLGAQTFPLQPPEGSFGTNHSMCCRPLLPSPGVGQPGPLRQFASCLCLRRPVYHSGWRWMSFHPGSRWTSSHPDQRSAGFHPDTFQRLQLPGPSLGRPLQVRSTAWSGHGSLGYWMPLEAWAGLGLTQLCQFPVVVTSEPYPSCEVTETL